MKNLSKAQAAHLQDHVDQLLSKTGAKSVESYFKSEDALSYEAVCDLLDIDPLPSEEEVAAQKAAEAYAAMTPREHRKAAQHLLVCPQPGHSVMHALYGESKSTTADKIASLNEALALLHEAEAHLTSAVAAYAAAEPVEVPDTAEGAE